MHAQTSGWIWIKLCMQVPYHPWKVIGVQGGVILLVGTYVETLLTARAHRVKVGMIIRAGTHDIYLLGGHGQN